MITDVIFTCVTCNIEDESMCGRRAMKNIMAKALRHEAKGHEASVSVTRLIVYDGK